MRTICPFALFTSCAAVSIGLHAEESKGYRPVQVVTFATPFRVTTNFYRTNGEALVATMPKDFVDKGFEPLLNLGSGRVWTGNYQEKISFVNNYLEKQKDPNKIVAFADGEDVILGGCHNDELLERYYDIVKKSGGAEIVFGAELFCFEPPNGKCPEPDRPEWAKKEINAEEFDKRARLFQNQQSLDDKTTSYINLNSGFYMGPVHELKKMMQYSMDADNWFKLHNGTDYYGDQRMYSQYWVENPDKVTLDYGAKLVFTAGGFKAESLKVNDEGDVHNNLFDHKQCVIHGNGYAKAFVGDIQMQRAESKGDKAVQMILKAHCLAMPETCTEGEKVRDQLLKMQNSFVSKITKDKSFVEGNLAEVRQNAEDQLRLLKTEDPKAFRETTKKFVSGNPVFLQLMEHLL